MAAVLRAEEEMTHQLNASGGVDAALTVRNYFFTIFVCLFISPLFH